MPLLVISFTMGKTRARRRRAIAHSQLSGTDRRGVPNFLYVTLIGRQVAGWWGALAVAVAVVVPPCLLTYFLARTGVLGGDGRIQRMLKNGVAPVSAALMLSSSWVLANTVDKDWQAALLTLVSLVVLLTTRLHPLWVIGAGAAIGLAGLV